MSNLCPTNGGSLSNRRATAHLPAPGQLLEDGPRPTDGGTEHVAAHGNGGRDGPERAFRCGGGRFGVRGLGDGLPAGGGRDDGLRAGAGQALPAGLVRPLTPGDAGQLLGSGPRSPGTVPDMELPRHRRGGLRRPRRRLTHLCQCAHPQGRALVHPAAARWWIRPVAGLPVTARPALRPRRVHVGSPTLPLRSPSLQHHAEDPPVPGRGPTAGTELEPPPAGGDLW